MRPIYLISRTPFPGVVHLPLLSIHFFAPDINFSAYKGLVFTSKEAVKLLIHYSDEWKQLPCICVSESTAKAAREAGAVDVESADGYGDTIPQRLQERGKEEKWLYLRPKEIASQWPDQARERGISLDEIVMYETVCAQEEKKILIDPRGVLIFTSPSSIECFSRQYEILATQDVVVIGKTTQISLPVGIKSTLSEVTTVASCVQKAREIASF